MKQLKQAGKFLCSMKCAVILLLVLAAACTFPPNAGLRSWLEGLVSWQPAYGWNIFPSPLPRQLPQDPGQNFFYITAVPPDNVLHL